MTDTTPSRLDMSASEDAISFSTEVDALYSADIIGFERSLLASLDAHVNDLLRIALQVYAIDRLTRRNRRSSWSAQPRVLRLVVSVADPGFWADRYVHGLLVQVLQFLSADEWDVRFRRDSAPRQMREGRLDFRERVDDVFLFSGGLDSVAGAATHLAANRDGQLAVTVLHQPGLYGTCPSLIRELRASLAPMLAWGRLSVSLCDPGRLDQQETSQRCRAFLFVSTGIAAALAAGARRVLMFESGTGAVNAPLMAGMATGARTTRSSHPYFLALMSELASLIAQRRISVELPFWQKTKAEFVRTLADLGLQKLAARSVSCAHLPRRSARRQCGVCAACITRRQALVSAGIPEPADDYEHDIFTSDSAAIPPTRKLADFKALLGQLMDFEDIGPSLELTPTLRQWLLGTRVVRDEQEAKPWLRVLWRYRCEWMELAKSHRHGALSWPDWLLTEHDEGHSHASGF